MSEQLESTGRPLPQPDDVSRPFFEGARRHVLMIQRCSNCGTYQLPGRFSCDECLAKDPEWVEASGRGTIFTFTVVHQRYHPAFADKIPYNVAVVELDEEPRLITNITGIDNDDIHVGMQVEVMFEDVTGEISLPQFRPAGNWGAEGTGGQITS
ncbi:MAG: uncharacterized protein QOI57_1382 [Rubrobacteraceae bacterium]|nr:uncharacterized protein [Rubrobacteraceae bacterium]